MTKLKLNLAQGAGEILSKDELKNVFGGIGSDEYCATMAELWKNNAGSWSADTIEGWWIGWNKHCK